MGGCEELDFIVAARLARDQLTQVVSFVGREAIACPVDTDNLE
jgi:hypothetical protein